MPKKQTKMWFTSPPSSPELSPESSPPINLRSSYFDPPTTIKYSWEKVDWDKFMEDQVSAETYITSNFRMKQFYENKFQNLYQITSWLCFINRPEEAQKREHWSCTYINREEIYADFVNNCPTTKPELILVDIDLFTDYVVDVASFIFHRDDFREFVKVDVLAGTPYARNIRIPPYDKKSYTIGSIRLLAPDFEERLLNQRMY